MYVNAKSSTNSKLDSNNVVPFMVVAAILKSNQASECRQGYWLPCTVRYLDYNTSGGYRLPCTVRYLDYNTSVGYRLPCTVRYLYYNTTSKGLYHRKVIDNLAFMPKLGYFSKRPPQKWTGLYLILLHSTIIVLYSLTVWSRTSWSVPFHWYLVIIKWTLTLDDKGRHCRVFGCPLNRWSTCSFTIGWFSPRDFIYKNTTVTFFSWDSCPWNIYLCLIWCDFHTTRRFWWFWDN
jgi:hypothetical protein